MKIELKNSDKVVEIDEADLETIRPYTWLICNDAPRFYALTYINRKPVRMHQMLTGFPKTDHKDGNGLNNKRDNLRVCNSNQNQHNRRKHKTGSSKYKGVRLTPTGKWQARIKFHSKEIYIGSFDFEIDAAKAYDSKAKELFGEFCNTNF